MATLGIIGSGNIGTAIARLAVAAGMDVVLANSRGPESLAGKVAELGERVRAATPQEAARAGDWVVVSIPLDRYRELPAAELAGKTVLDTINYYPIRDGRIEVLDAEETTTTELVQGHLTGAKLVKAFNNISAFHIASLARPAGAADRTALPIAGNDPEANVAAAALIDKLGFDTVDAGSLAETWRFEPETPAYAVAYCAHPEAMRAFLADLPNAGPTPSPPDDPGAPLPAGKLRTLLADAHRPPVADRVM
ncbi:NADPH-dependent F420 reductase [Streptomyces sp. NPDC005962]|uniref:NADPH-dependent F420 reductase n=1 Tax=Streptomyces sp. NPDC005962 TaxID=3154466 RepID=UPI0033E389B8